jgi:hypothetical protein
LDIYSIWGGGECIWISQFISSQIVVNMHIEGVVARRVQFLVVLLPHLNENFIGVSKKYKEVNVIANHKTSMIEYKVYVPR